MYVYIERWFVELYQMISSCFINRNYLSPEIGNMRIPHIHRRTVGRNDKKPKLSSV
jgi:hypothetical protein